MTFLSIALGLAVFAGGLQDRALKDGWRKFTSEENSYSCYFPPQWHYLPPALGNLRIVNFPLSQKVRGVVLPQGGALVVILERPDNVGDVERWIKTTTIGAETISKKDVSRSEERRVGKERR